MQTGYYRITQSAESEYNRKHGFVDGVLVYVYADQEKLEVRLNGHMWTFDCGKPEDMQEFTETFEFEPNGSEIRQAEIAALMQEISSVDVATSAMQKQLTNFNPCVSDTGEISETGSELAVVADIGV